MEPGAENFYLEPEKKSEAGEKWLGSTKSLQRVSESNLIKRKKYKVNICSFFIISVGAGMAPNKRGMAPALQHFFKYTVAWYFVCAQDFYFSSVFFLLRIIPYIIDLGSANGTYLNNQKIEPQRYYELKVSTGTYLNNQKIEPQR